MRTQKSPSLNNFSHELDEFFSKKLPIYFGSFYDGGSGWIGNYAYHAESRRSTN
jgi:hypothetical protein